MKTTHAVDKFLHLFTEPQLIRNHISGNIFSHWCKKHPYPNWQISIKHIFLNWVRMWAPKEFLNISTKCLARHRLKFPDTNSYILRSLLVQLESKRVFWASQARSRMKHNVFKPNPVIFGWFCMPNKLWLLVWCLFPGESSFFQFTKFGWLHV